jgi:large subunit ribosomal protein L3
MGKKIGMTRVYGEDGHVIPVTAIEAGPCYVLQVKSEETDGYNAIQVGFANRSEKRVNKPMAGHFRKAGKGCFHHVCEFRVDDPAAYEPGQEITIDALFKPGELVDITGTSKGRGFQGVVKRHGFKGGKKTHGSMFHRAPGSIGCSAWPSRVIKGKKLPGHMGDRTVTKKNVIVIDVRPEDNLLLVKGGVPGARSGLLKIYTK